MFGWLNAAQATPNAKRFHAPAQELAGQWKIARIEIPKDDSVRADINSRLLSEPMFLPIGQVIHIQSIGPYIITRTLTTGPESEIKAAEMVEITLQPPFLPEMCQHEIWGVFCYDIETDKQLEMPIKQIPRTFAAYVNAKIDRVDPDVLRHGQIWNMSINRRLQYVFQYEDYSFGDIVVHPAGPDTMVWTLPADKQGMEGLETVTRPRPFVGVILERISKKTQ